MTDQPSASGEQDGVEPASHCPWCAAPAAADATTCRECGAALAQRDSIADVRIPGLTAVDPALEDYAKRPMHLRGPSPSQGMAPALIVGAVAGGPIGLMAIGGVAAVAGAEFLGTRQGGGGTTNLEDLGKPSEVLLQALEHERTAEAAGPATALGSMIAADAEAESGSTRGDEPAMEPDAAAADGGMSIWRDLPPDDRDTGPEGSV
jgi:hypothetical protein